MSKAFDPNSFRVEELFKAKEERRQRLAKLPFEEKIKIVKRLQTGVSALMKNEKLIFESFLKTCPDFADEPIDRWDGVEEWYAKRALTPPSHPYDKRPDIICVTSSGKKIGVELKSWVNREQITEARKQERIHENQSGHFSLNGMRETLKSALLAHKSDEKYKDLKAHAGLDEIYLLLHYDFKAFAYNTPFDAPAFGFKEAAELASSELGGDGGYFDRIFLFHFLWGKEEAKRIL